MFSYVCNLNQRFKFYAEGISISTFVIFANISLLSIFSNLYTHGVSTIQFLCLFGINGGGGQINRVAHDFYFQGDYDIRGYLDMYPFASSCLPSGNFSGTGVATFEVQNLIWVAATTHYFNINTGEVILRNLTMYISFDRVYLDLGPNFRINGSPVDWEAFNANLHSCFHTEFNQYKGEIETKLMSAINDRFAQFNLYEIIEFLFEGSCPRCYPI